MSIFGKFLSDRRQELKMSQWKLHQESGVSTTYINNLEKGKNEPKPDILKKLAAPLKMDYYDLMEKAGHIKRDKLGDWIKLPPISDPEDQQIVDLLKKMSIEKKRHWIALLRGD